MLYIYTGEGKGKTTAAVGLLTRARGARLSCAVVFFDKNPDFCHELGMLKQLGVEAYIFGANRVMEGSFRFGNNELDMKEAFEAFETAKKLAQDDIQVLVLDEILNAVRLEQISLESVLDFIDAWPENLYLIMTGRGLPDQIKKQADLITDMTAVRHPFDDKSLPAQPGIDY